MHREDFLAKVPTIPLKGPCTIFAFIQLMLAVVQLAYNFFTLAFDESSFRYGEVRATLQFYCALTVVWVIFTVIGLSGLISDRPNQILVHCIFCLFFFIFESFVLLILIFNSRSVLSISLSMITVFVLGFSLHYERLCFKLMSVVN